MKRSDELHEHGVQKNAWRVEIFSAENFCQPICMLSMGWGDLRCGGAV